MNIDLQDLDPAGTMTVRDLAAAAGLITWDGAVPQPWYDAHQKEITERGGAVWCYDAHVVGPQHKMMGAPVYFDTLGALARLRRAAMLPEHPTPTTRPDLYSEPEPIPDGLTCNECGCTSYHQDACPHATLRPMPHTSTDTAYWAGAE